MDYKIEIYKAGVKLAEINNAANISFDRTQNTGCGCFSISLATRFDNYASIVDYDNEVKIYVNNVLYYTGIIIDYTPDLALSEKVTITGSGYSEEFNWAYVNGVYNATEVTAIMQDIVTTYILPYGDITIGTVEPTGLIVDTITFNNVKVKDALQTLQELSGVNCISVDENKKFNVQMSFISNLLRR